MRRPSCFLMEGQTEIVRDERAANVDEPSCESEWEKKSGGLTHCAQDITMWDSAPRAREKTSAGG